MSYCRWSSDNFKCDIYAYESVGDFWQIYIASKRIVGEPPQSNYKLLKNGDDKSIAEFVQQEKIRSEWMDKCDRVPIGLPYDGESFECNTIQEFYDKMIELRSIGYHFPDYVLEEIKEEMNTKTIK